MQNFFVSILLSEYIKNIVFLNDIFFARWAGLEPATHWLHLPPSFLKEWTISSPSPTSAFGGKTRLNREAFGCKALRIRVKRILLPLGIVSEPFLTPYQNFIVLNINPDVDWGSRLGCRSPFKSFKRMNEGFLQFTLFFTLVLLLRAAIKVTANCSTTELPPNIDCTV